MCHENFLSSRCGGNQQPKIAPSRPPPAISCRCVIPGARSPPPLLPVLAYPPVNRACTHAHAHARPTPTLPGLARRRAQARFRLFETGAGGVVWRPGAVARCTCGTRPRLEHVGCQPRRFAPRACGPRSQQRVVSLPACPRCSSHAAAATRRPPTPERRRAGCWTCKSSHA